MQVTIDTRHDTLEEALAVIQLAFAGASEPPSAKLRRTSADRQEEDCGQEESVIRVT